MGHSDRAMTGCNREKSTREERKRKGRIERVRMKGRMSGKECMKIFGSAAVF
jgi:hypothetical protein